jgi:hypothetical protein
VTAAVDLLLRHRSDCCDAVAAVMTSIWLWLCLVIAAAVVSKDGDSYDGA